MKRFHLFWLSVVMIVAGTLPAQAHFPWIVRDAGADSGPVLHVYFGETAIPDDPELLSFIEKASVTRIASDGKTEAITLKKGEDSLTTPLDKTTLNDSIFVLHHDLGVMSRGNSNFHLVYFAKSGPQVGDVAWQKVDCSKQAKLDVIPTQAGDQLTLSVLWDKTPVADADVTVSQPDGNEAELKTDNNGQAQIDSLEEGLYSIRVRHIEEVAGEVDGKAYTQTRYYTTVALNVAPSAATPTESAIAEGKFPKLPRMAQPVTSFGAAITDGKLYVYGGNTGGAHSYNNQIQDNTLWELELKDNAEWKSLGKGPRLQGLALLAHDGNVYRIGGFSAKNEPGDDSDLRSQSEVSRYNIKDQKWTEIAPLPEPRSSFDAAILNDSIYVIGGWSLNGDDGDSTWHNTAYVMSLKDESPSWTPITPPTFLRRALSVAAFNGKIYAIGGMQDDDEVTTRVDVYNPETKEWTQGPSLIEGESMTGFGTSAFAQAGRLYVSTIDGTLQSLTPDEKEWQVLGKTPTPRFFHRLLAYGDDQLLTLGGASMKTGKFVDIEFRTVEK